MLKPALSYRYINGAWYKKKMALLDERNILKWIYARRRVRGAGDIREKEKEHKKSIEC